MKKYVVYIAAVVSFSCSEDFLELAPKDQPNISEFYNTAEDFEVALIGAYGSLLGGSYADNFLYLTEFRSDNTIAAGTRGSYQSISNFDLGAQDGIVDGLYTNSYQIIQAANAIIERVGTKNFDTAVKNTILGRAKFVRAYAYFNLITLFGDVPLILTETTGESLAETRELARTPVNQVFAQIVQDLKDAETNISGPFETPHLGSSLSASALLGKVYLQQRDFTSAVFQFNKVITSSQFSLEPVFSNLYKPGKAGNSESIFVIEHVGSANGTGSGLGFQMAPRLAQLGDFEIFNQGLYVTPELRNEYEAQNDSIRRDMTALEWFSPGDEIGRDTVYISMKYRDDNPFEQNNGSNNFYVLRYADILLAQAEALNEVGYQAGGEAFQHLNEVRARAGIDALDATDLPDQTSFREAILLERRLELAMEAKRWYDLLRSGMAIEAIANVASNDGANITITQDDLLFPIPEGEISNNPDVIEQNPGY